jgi:lysophospholipase L1-like esterase
VIVQLGVNEMNTGVDAAAYQANLTALNGQFAAAGSDVLVCLSPPALVGYAMDMAHRAAVPAACALAGVSAPVDLHAGIGFDVATYLADFVHPNADGTHKIVNTAARVDAPHPRFRVITPPRNPLASLRYWRSIVSF